MIIKFIAPFRTHFSLRGELLSVYSDDYARFWDNLRKDFIKNEQLEKNYFQAVRFLHTSDYTRSENLQYVATDIDGLKRPVHAIELEANPHYPGIDNAVQAAATEALHPVTDSADNISGLIEAFTKSTSKTQSGFQPERLSFRLFNHTIGIVEVDAKLSEEELFLSGTPVNHIFKTIASLGNAFVDKLVHHYYREAIFPFLQTTSKVGQSSKINYIKSPREMVSYRDLPRKKIDPVKELSQTGSRGEPKATTDLLWVSRTLIFEQSDTFAKEAIIDFWLGEVGKKEEVERVKKDPTAASLSWGNYLFREGAYEAEAPSLPPDSKQRLKPFCDEWDAMLLCQYYYSALDCLDSGLRQVFGLSFVTPNKQSLSGLRQKLENIIVDAHSLLLDFHQTEKFLKRRKYKQFRTTLDYWNFPRMMTAAEKKISLCSERIDSLHQRSVERGTLITDMILLGIGFTSIISLFVSLSEYGRRLATDVNYGSFDTNELNILGWVSQKTTDSILLFGALATLGLATLYFFVRRRSLLSD